MEVDRETLVLLYEGLGFSLAEVGAVLGKSEETARRLLISFGIPRRHKTARFGGWNKGLPLPIEQRAKLSAARRDLYASGRLAHWNSGKHWPRATRERISAALLGGRKRSPAAYGRDWQLQRSSCLQRDSYTCQQCGATARLEVHHWEPYRFSFNNDLDNLVTLCVSCHDALHETYRREGFIAIAEAETYGQDF